MAFLRIALSQARRQSPHHALSFQYLRSPRFLSSTSSARDADASSPKPVSYAGVNSKPKLPAADPQASEPIASTNLESTWTKEDARYLKDAWMPSAASTARVAPLPELDSVEKEVDENDASAGKEIGDGRRWKMSSLNVDEEMERVPFPRLIKVEKKPPKPIYDLDEAIKLVVKKGDAKRKFVETVEAHAQLAVNQRRTDLAVSGMTTLPHGTGKVVKVAVFAQGTDADEAKSAGAYIVGAADLVEGILNGTVKIDEFDTCIATPQMIPQIQKLARILGKHGLFPNAKKGTIVSDVAKAVEEAKRGRINFKMDKTSIVHVGLGKVDFAEDKLKENIAVFANALLLAKPAGLKKTSKYAGYLNSFHLCSTMGPGYAISIDSLAKAADQVTRLQVK